MVAITVNIIGWILCALLIIFVISGTTYGIYTSIRNLNDKIKDTIADRKRIKEKDEAKRLAEMTEEQIAEEKQIEGETKFTLFACGVILLLIIVIFIIKKY